MKIRALVPFSTGTITMEQYEIKEVADEVGAALVAAKLVTEIKDEGEAFVVKMTLTSESGGTMDHTNVEILNAYRAGKAIMFDITLGTITYRVQATLVADFDGVEYPGFSAIVVNTNHQLVHLYADPYRTETNTFTMSVEELGGGGSDALVVTDTDGTLDKTWQEIRDAFVAGSVRIQKGTDTNTLGNVQCVEYSSREGYLVKSGYLDRIYTASLASDYPAL